MLKHLKYLILIILLPVFISCHEEERRQIPIRDFFKTPDKSFFKISPDGKYLSYLKPYKERQNLFILSLADGKERMATSFTDNAVRDYVWTFNNQLIFSQDVNELEEFKMYALDVNTLQIRTLLSLNKGRIRLLSRNRKKPDEVTIIMNKRNPATFDVYRLNIKTNELALYITNPGNITDWYPDNNGKILLAKASDGVDETILFRANEQAPFKPIIKNNFKNKVDPIAFTNEGSSTFYALSNVNRDKTALVEINANTGREESVIYATDKADILDVGYSRNKHRLEYVGWEDAKPHKYFLNKEADNIYIDLKKKLNNGAIRFVDRDTAETRFVFYTYTDRNPGTSYLYEKKTGKLTQLSNLNTSFKSAELCTMKPVSFKASDGMLINGYLTLPLGSKEKNFPVVVMPHDGPWSRNNWGYSAEVQFLANRGYAVFQVNYRGSIGYGKAFLSAGFKQVGGKIQEDITDGVKWLIDQEIADPKKIAIMGSRFGGFSALYGVSFHPGMYNCAVVQYGLLNFFTFLRDIRPEAKPRLQMTYEMVGNPEADANLFRAISPVFHADKIKAPLIMFQGAKDPKANISEINQFVRELQKNNVQVKYFQKENERFYFKSEHNRMEMYSEIEKFLNNHMKVKP